MFNEADGVQEATAFAIARAKVGGATEVTADDLLVGCLRAVSRFGVVEIGRAVIDLELLGVDWLHRADAAKGKVSYSQAVVDILDRAAIIAKRDGADKVRIDHLLVAFAGSDCAMMAQLQTQYGITSASWRAAAAAMPMKESPVPAAAPEAQAATRAYLSPEEAAAELGIHVQTLRAYVRSGKLPALRLAGERAIRIRREDLHHLLEPFQPEG